jgi:hypothetical protein
VAHQPRHAMLAHLVALFAERPPDARTAVGLATVLMEHADGDQEGPIGRRPADSRDVRATHNTPAGETASARHMRRIG